MPSKECNKMLCPANKANRVYKERERPYTKQMVNENKEIKEAVPLSQQTNHRVYGSGEASRTASDLNMQLYDSHRFVLSFGRPLPRTSRLG